MTEDPDKAHLPRDPVRRRLRWALPAAAGVIAVCGAPWALDAWDRRETVAVVMRQLVSDQPVQRKLGAWRAAELEVTGATRHMARVLELGEEPVADVREAFVYALGTTGRAEYFPIVGTVTATDPSGYVRQAAWLAAARIDAARFRALAEATPPASDAWDRIGRANAWLRVGDARGVPTLLGYARRGTDGQQRVACQALYKGVRPLLEAAGQWPLGADVEEGAIWPPALLEQVAQRCRELNLQRIATDSWPHFEAARLVVRDVHRLTSAREWIAWFLFRL